MIKIEELELGKTIDYKGELIILSKVTYRNKRKRVEAECEYLTRDDAARRELHNMIPKTEKDAKTFRSFGQVLKISYPEYKSMRLTYQVRRAMKYI